MEVSRISSGETLPASHLKWGLDGPQSRAGRDESMRESNPGRVARSPLLYRLSCLSMRFSFFAIEFHLQSVPVHSATCVKTYAAACRRVLSSAPL
jgi:hypothetical protein